MSSGLKPESDSGFTIVSWNINGMRTLNMKQVLEVDLNFNCSILAVQETKLSRNQLEESQALVNNYSSYFSFSKNRAGYSGVATYCHNRIAPSKAEDALSGLTLDTNHKGSEQAIGSYCTVQEEDLSNARYGDCDGRSVITQHVVNTPDGEEKRLNVINVYCPRLRDDPSDQMNNNKQFKMTFHNLLAERAKNLVKAGEFVLIVGDLNVSHQMIDQSEIDDPKQFHQTEFKDWLDELISPDKAGGFRDTFRVKHPSREKAFTCWCTKLNARQNNYGARIDFILADDQLTKYLDDAEIHPNILGSDHCPVSATFHSLTPKNIIKIPALATKFYPEYAGKQQKLTDLFKKSELQSPHSQNQQLKISSFSTLVNRNDKRKAQSTSKGVAKQTSLVNFFTKKAKTDSEERECSTKRISPTQDTESTNFQESASQSSQEFFKQINSTASQKWRQLLKTPHTPICDGHKESCVLRTVKKKGVHQGRQFWSCARGSGKTGDPNATCNFFQWANVKNETV